MPKKMLTMRLTFTGGYSSLQTANFMCKCIVSNITNSQALYNRGFFDSSLGNKQVLGKIYKSCNKFYVTGVYPSSWLSKCCSALCDRFIPFLCSALCTFNSPVSYLAHSIQTKAAKQNNKKTDCMNGNDFCNEALLLPRHST